MKTLFFILSMLLAVQPCSAALNPNGSFGNPTTPEPVAGTNAEVCNSDEWGDDFLAVFNERENTPEGQQAIESILTGVRNETEFCSTPLRTPAGAKLFALELAEAFFVKESGCNPAAANPHAPNGTAVGFGQMGIDDAKNHKCTTADGQRVSSEDQLKDPVTNARCVAQIMINCASGLNGQEPRHIGRIADGDRGQYGFAGCFWQPMRKGTGGDGQGGSVDNQANRDQIAEVTRNFCEQAARGSQALLVADLVSQDNLCAAMNNRSCSGSSPYSSPNMTTRGTTVTY